MGSGGFCICRFARPEDGTEMTKPVTRKMAVDCLLHRFAIDGTYDAWGCGRLPCGICGKDLVSCENIQFDHVHADVHGGEHHFSNLRPVHAECHKAKTKSDIQANAKVKRILANKPSKRPMQNSGRKIPSRPFSRRKRCDGCESGWADPPSKLCPGCQAYREHQA